MYRVLHSASTSTTRNVRAVLSCSVRTSEGSARERIRESRPIDATDGARSRSATKGARKQLAAAYYVVYRYTI
jgi:hypothetical protein